MMRYGESLGGQLEVRAGQFLFIPAGMPHLPFNPSDREPCVAILARTDPSEQESVVLLDPNGRRPGLGRPAEPAPGALACAMISSSRSSTTRLRNYREWAKGLADDERPEARAAAKAILLLADDLGWRPPQSAPRASVDKAGARRAGRRHRTDTPSPPASATRGTREPLSRSSLVICGHWKSRGLPTVTDMWMSLWM